MNKSKYNGKDIYWNEKKNCWCYMNHRPIPKDIEDKTGEYVSLTTRLVKFFKGE